MTIRQRQHLLAYLGYYTAEVDGDWGVLSREACIDFQRDMGISADGLGGPETDQALKQAVSEDLLKNGAAEKENSGTFWDEIEYFGPAEFACKCGGRYCDGYPARIQEQVVRLADGARKYFGRPGHVVSGLRCRQWNALQGGVENSQHMYGEAVDLRIDGVSAEQLLAYIGTQPHRYAYAINGTNVHVDIPKGAR